MKVILVHGAGTWHGKSPLFNLTRYFRERRVDCIEFRYGLVLSAWGWWRNKSGSIHLAEMLTDGDVVISHSNGAVVADDAIRIFLDKRRPAWPVRLYLIALSPALDSDHRFNSYWDHVSVFHNSGDDLAWWADHIPWPFPAYRWGDMLATGIMDRELRPWEHNVSIPEFMGKNVDYEHSRYLEHPSVSIFGPKIVELAASLEEKYGSKVRFKRGEHL